MHSLRADAEKSRTKWKRRASGGWWRFLDNERLRWWANTLAIPIVLGSAAHFYQQEENARAEKARDAADARAVLEKRLTLYTQLLSSREAADTEVRRGIFDKVLEKYLEPGSRNVEKKLVALDLMSANFHDSLDLSPLFWQLDRAVVAEHNAARRNELLNELARIAGEVKARQVEVLQIAGDVKEIPVNLEDLKQNKLVTTQEFDLAFSDHTGARYKHHFSFDVVEPDPSNRRLHVQFGVDDRPKRTLVWADLYDFPLVTFTRLSTNERIAVVLQEIDSEVGRATILFIYYPSARSGIKDKPFIDEVIDSLMKPEAAPPAKHGFLESLLEAYK